MALWTNSSSNVQTIMERSDLSFKGKPKSSVVRFMTGSQVHRVFRRSAKLLQSSPQQALREKSDPSRIRKLKQQ
jgi:hypothetical protein